MGGSGDEFRSLDTAIVKGPVTSGRSRKIEALEYIPSPIPSPPIPKISRPRQSHMFLCDSLQSVNRHYQSGLT